MILNQKQNQNKRLRLLRLRLPEEGLHAINQKKLKIAKLILIMINCPQETAENVVIDNQKNQKK